MKVNATRKRHGLRNTPEYYSWKSMLKRCYYQKAKDYSRYGGRGITVCDKWRQSFMSFFLDMGARPEGCTLDRINNDLGYSPENCRWATYAEQTKNRREPKNSITVRPPLEQDLPRLAKHLGIPLTTLCQNIAAAGRKKGRGSSCSPKINTL